VHKQSPSQITVSDNQNAQSLLGVAVMLLVMLLATGANAMLVLRLHTQLHINFGKVSVA
jgi:hypothetical protein